MASSAEVAKENASKPESRSIGNPSRQRFRRRSGRGYDYIFITNSCITLIRHH